MGATLAYTKFLPNWSTFGQIMSIESPENLLKKKKKFT